MPRTARTVVQGYCYHLINRGNNRAPIFHDANDYRRFLSLVSRSSGALAATAACGLLMPNHVHLVVQPREEDDLARWTHWTFTTHARRYHARYKTSGRVWQGRFKAFVIEEDAHLLTVLRYVERNALRSGLTSRAEHWRWGSLSWREGYSPSLPLTPSPVPLPSNWLAYVNEAQTTAELDAIRTLIYRQRPFGSRGWAERAALELGLVGALRDIGRPRKERV